MADEVHVRAEAAVAELADLVADLRGGGFIERGRILARGARILRGLTPRQRRTLAIEIARNAAPQLVERITAEGGAAGDVDLSPAQVKAVFDMVSRLDEEGAGNLAERLRDPQWQRDALGLLATDGLDAVAASAGYDEVGRLLEAGSLEEYEDAIDVPVAPDDVRHEEDDPDAGDLDRNLHEPEVTAPSLEDQRATQAEVIRVAQSAEAREDQAIVARAAQAQAEIAPDFAPAPAAYTTSMPEFVGYRPAGIDPDLFSFGPPAAAATAAAKRVQDQPHPDGSAPTSEAPGDRVRSAPDVVANAPTPRPGGATTGEAVASERSWFGGGDLGIAELAPERTPLADRLRMLDRPSHRLRLVTSSIDEVAAMATDEQVGVLLALPDGWVRRRALHRLLEHAGISRSGAPKLLQTLTHDIDRAWAAASMVEDGIVAFDDIAASLTERTRVRLAARYTETED